MGRIQLTPIVKNLLIINVIVFIFLQLPLGEGLRPYFALYKLDWLMPHPEYQGYTLFRPVQIVTYFFTHDLKSVFHILFNMLMLVSLGPVLEMAMTSKRFFKFYLFCGVVGGLIIVFLDPSFIPVVGASVALSGILVAFAFYFPQQRLGFFLLPISFEARQLAMGFAVISAVLAFLQWQEVPLGFFDGISHFGHLSGMIAGWLFFNLGKQFPQLFD